MAPITGLCQSVNHLFPLIIPTAYERKNLPDRIKPRHAAKLEVPARRHCAWECPSEGPTIARTCPHVPSSGPWTSGRQGQMARTSATAEIRPSLTSGSRLASFGRGYGPRRSTKRRIFSSTSPCLPPYLSIGFRDLFLCCLQAPSTCGRSAD